MNVLLLIILTGCGVFLLAVIAFFLVLVSYDRSRDDNDYSPSYPSFEAPDGGSIGGDI
jgi:hypothetical protein